MRLALCFLSFLVAAAPSAQYQPAIDFASVLKGTYSSKNGNIKHGHLGMGYMSDIRFGIWLPNGPEEIQAGEMAVLYPDGSPIASTPLAALDRTDMSSIFVVSGDNPSWHTTLEPALEYRYTLSLGDNLMVDFPFTASVSGGDDPYTTSDDRQWGIKSGPWFTHSLFQQNEDGHLAYFMWIRVEDRLAPSRAGHDFEVSIRRDGQEVAWGFDDREEYMRHFPILSAASRHDSGAFGRRQGHEWWTASSITPGTYQVVVTRDDGLVVSEQTIEGGDGAFVPHTRSALEYQPRSRFLTPVRPEGLDGDRSNGPFSLFWIAPE